MNCFDLYAVASLDGAAAVLSLRHLFIAVLLHIGWELRTPLAKKCVAVLMKSGKESSLWLRNLCTAASFSLKRRDAYNYLLINAHLRPSERRRVGAVHVEARAIDQQRERDEDERQRASDDGRSDVVVGTEQCQPSEWRRRTTAHSDGRRRVCEAVPGEQLLHENVNFNSIFIPPLACYHEIHSIVESVAFR